MLYLPVRNEGGSNPVFLPVENADAFHGLSAFFHLVTNAGTITARRATDVTCIKTIADSGVYDTTVIQTSSELDWPASSRTVNVTM